MEGTFEGRLKEEALVGERVKAVKHSDNLRIEGSMQLVSEAHSAGKAVQKVNYNAKSKTASSSTRKDVQSSIVIGDDTSSTTRAIAEHQAKRASSASSSKQVAQTSSSAAVSKQSKSIGVASTVIQSKDQEATIKAVN